MPQAETTAWVAAVVGDGGTVSATRQALVDNLIVGLKADSIFTKFDRLWLFRAENPQSALRDIVAASAATPFFSPIFTVNQGYLGTTPSYIDSNFNPATAGSPQYVQNSAHMSVWNNTNVAPAIAYAIIGQGAGNNIYIKLGADDLSYYRINDDIETAGYAIGDPTGLLIGNRSGVNAVEAYKNGVLLGSDTGTSKAVVNSTIGILVRYDFNNTPDLFHQIAAASIGGSLDSTQAAAFSARMSSFMASANSFAAFSTPQDAGRRVTRIIRY